MKPIILKKNKLLPLSGSIRKLLTWGSLTMFTPVSGATEFKINPNEIWLHPTRNSSLIGICVKDIDQDGDLDILKLLRTGTHPTDKLNISAIALLENVGTPDQPNFISSVPYASNLNDKQFRRLELADCELNHLALVDIDADGDLDLFSSSKETTPNFIFSRNEGTTENPIYVTEDPNSRFNLPINRSDFMFKDIDNDGDLDYWNHTENPDPKFYENIGTPEEAKFVKQNNPIQLSCPLINSPLINTPGLFTLGFLFDLNNDEQLDILCVDRASFSYIESIGNSFLPIKTFFNPVNYNSNIDIQALDLNDDGHLDLLSSSFRSPIFYSNLSDDTIPRFDSEQLYTSIPENILDPLQLVNTRFADLDSDNDIDQIRFSKSKIDYIPNTGTTQNPIFNEADTNPIFEQCIHSLPTLVDSYDIRGIDLVDIDGDTDLDLFISLKSTGMPLISDIIYCQNQGNSTHPSFASGIKNPFDIRHADLINAGNIEIDFGDMDGDGDQDVLFNGFYLDNIGNSKHPLFKKISFLARPTSFTLGLDLDGDGRIESSFKESTSVLLFKGLEPVTQIAATTSEEFLVLALIRPSQVQLLQCFFDKCSHPIVLNNTASEISISNGDFNGDGKKNEILIAMIDTEGNLKVEFYTNDFLPGIQLLARYSGPSAHSIAVSAGQLDNDPADEGVVSFVGEDGRVVVASFNIDGSIIGSSILNAGTQTSVAVGNFDENNTGFALTYLSPDNTIETATFQADATPIAQWTDEKATYASVNSANIIGSTQDEVIVSLIQPDGIAGLIGFDANSQRLGKVTGNDLDQPKTLAGNFLDPNQTSLDASAIQPGLAVSMILPDKRPAISFLNNQGQLLATGIGGTTAAKATIALTDINHDGIDEGILVYVDEAGLPRWEVFNANGKPFR